MQAKQGSRAYSLGQRRLPAARRRSVRRKGEVTGYVHQLAAALKTVAGARRVLAVAALPVVLLAVIVVAFNLPQLKVTQVEIVGGKALDINRVKASLRLDGQNLLAIDAPMIEKMLRQQPAVKAVTVRRQWPNKVIVQVEERRPVAIWQTPEGAFAVDEEGYVISEAQAQGPLPAIVAQEGGLRVGSRVPQGVMGLSKDIISRMPRESGAQPRQFQYSTSLGLAVVTDQGWKAIFGDDRDLDFKMATLAVVLRTAKERKLAFQQIDLRFGERPFLR